MNHSGRIENGTCSSPNGGTCQHDVLAGVNRPVEIEWDASTVGKNKNDDLALASLPREDAPPAQLDSELNGEVSKSNGYSASKTENQNEDGVDRDMHEMVSSQEDGPTQNGLRHRVVHSQPVFKAAEQNGFAEL
jgi:hypothetical protein